MLAKNPDHRYQTPTEAIDALRAAVEPEEEEPSDPGIVRDESPLERPAPARAPSAVDTPPEQPTRRTRVSPPRGLNTVPDDPVALGLTPEMREAASRQYAHATDVIRSGGDLAYAQQLLQDSCRLDPTNLMYRKMLREVTRDLGGGRKGSWFGSLTNLPARGRLKKARHAGEHRKALECGEELLCRAPGDVQAQLEMADSAEELGLAGLAVWLLEEARSQDAKSVPILRALGELFERQKRFNQAIAVWEKVRELLPHDVEAADKIRALSVSETLARGGFRG
jgi:tetratricopeptide (TPR) repeat protein